MRESSDLVAESSTRFDKGTSTVEVVLVLVDDAPDNAISTITVRARRALSALDGDVGDDLGVSIEEAPNDDAAGTYGSLHHMGGEVLNYCTSGFTAKDDDGDWYVATAGHCEDSMTDDGESLYVDGTQDHEHEGSYGDFQLMTSMSSNSQIFRDDFYAGTGSTTETNGRDVQSVAYPFEGLRLCQNGKITHQNCGDVKELDVCSQIGNTEWCDLVAMEYHESSIGDSGGPVYRDTAALGFIHGYKWIDGQYRDLFSLAWNLDNAVGATVATSN